MPEASQHDPAVGRNATRQTAPLAQGPLLNRIFWRWHFWAGLLIAPVLIVASITGAIYIFKSELEAALYPGVIRSAEPGPRASLEKMISAVEETAPSGWRAVSVEINNMNGGVHAVILVNDEHHHRRIYVDANKASILGELPSPNFFGIVLSLHRRLFAGTLGRVLVELATCWTVLLTLTGLWLWWPKNWRRIGAALMPRLCGKPYRLLRDWHAIPGTLAAPLVVVIAVTGLLYSVLWGTSFLATGYLSGAFDVALNPPRSLMPSDPAAAIITADLAYEIAQQNGLPVDRVTIELPQTADDPYAVQAGRNWGPSVVSIVHVDQYSGYVLQAASLGDLPLMAQWTQWNYPLHVGSVMGAATKVIWLLVCVVLATAPATGLLMWRHRCKPGSSGMPRRLEARLPRWVVVAAILLGVAMPMAGISMLVITAMEWRRSYLAACK